MPDRLSFELSELFLCYDYDLEMYIRFLDTLMVRAHAGAKIGYGFWIRWVSRLRKSCDMNGS